MVGSALLKKFIREILRAKGQFISIIILSALGVLVFSGLDGAWRNIDLSLGRYFEEYRLSDFWVIAKSAGPAEIARIAGLNGVSDAQGRFSGEVETTLPGDPKLTLHAVEGEARINIPKVDDGRTLTKDDLQGCLLDKQFAAARGLLPGDAVTLKIAGRKITFLIRGLIRSPEYVFTAKDIIPEPKQYGFIYANLDSFEGLPVNEICVLLGNESEAGAVK
jgi:putative ABC transport system permease protein